MGTSKHWESGTASNVLGNLVNTCNLLLPQIRAPGESCKKVAFLVFATQWINFGQSQGGLILTQPILKNASLLRRKHLRWLRVNIEEKSNSLHVILSTAARKYKHCGSAIYHPEKTTQQKHLISRGHPWLSSLFVSRWNPSKEVHSEQQECLHRGWKNIFQAEKPAVHHHQATPFTFNTIVHCYHLLATIKLGVAIA